MVKKTSLPAGQGDNVCDDPLSSLAFEDAIEELESLVERMEQGSLSLEESLAAYRRGSELVTHCRGSLARVQQQVKVLEGELLRSFEPDAESSERSF